MINGQKLVVLVTALVAFTSATSVEKCIRLKGTLLDGKCYSYQGKASDVVAAELEVFNAGRDCPGGCAIDGICVFEINSKECEAQNPANLCPDGVWANA